jgi:hypothetical protein
MIDLICNYDAKGLLMSSANGLSGYVDYDGRATQIGPVGLAAGAAPPPFEQTTKVRLYDHSYGLDAGNPVHPALNAELTNVADTAASPGIGVDSIGTAATSDIGSAAILSADYPPAVMGIVGLDVQASFIHSASTASYVFGANRALLAGGASFGSLSIQGALIGNTVTFSGTPAANAVLYSSPTVTITLDKQAISDFLPPSGGAVGPNRITTDALDIHLNNAQLFGKTISGDIVLGESSAALWPPLHA